MMGVKERACGPLPSVSLEDLVPADHCSRHLERALDLAFVRDLVRGAYADRGRPAIDPVVFFKLQLILFFEGLRSERQLLRVAADRLSLRWYLGYDLTAPLPDHASLTRLRERYGLDVFRRFFAQIVEQCVGAGLVWGEELYIDATKVAANADLDSLQPRFAVEAHLTRLFATECGWNGGDYGGDDAKEDQDRGEARPTRLPLVLPDAARTALAERVVPRPDRIGEAGRPNHANTSGAYRRTADFRVSTTAPDASPMPPGAGRTHLGYQDHDVVDGGKARIILAALVTLAEVQENQPALDLLWWARFRWKLRPRQVTGDTKDGTVENVAAIEQKRIRADLPLSAVGHRPGLFRDTDFAYDAQTDTYRCPGDTTLRFISQDDRTRRRVYEVPAAACAVCALRTHCTTSRRGRRVGRSLDETCLERVRNDHATEPFEGAAETEGVGGTALSRGERLAWLAPVPPAGPAEGQRRGAADRGGPEPQALAAPAGVGTAPVAERGGRGRANGQPAAHRRRTMTRPSSSRSPAARCQASCQASRQPHLFQLAAPSLQRHLASRRGRLPPFGGRVKMDGASSGRGLAAIAPWSEAWADLRGRIGRRFARAEARERAGRYLAGLLGRVERKNGWQLAEAMGEVGPRGVQRLLSAAVWDADGVRDDLRGYVVDHLGDEATGVLIVDETGFLKKGRKSCGVARQYTGTAGDIVNCQVGVLLAYASRAGAAFIDRALYLPQEWAEDRTRRAEAGIPEATVFATKIELAQCMLARAFAAGVPARWVVGDAFYGRSHELRRWLEEQGRAYALMIPKTNAVWYQGRRALAGQFGERLCSEPALGSWACLELSEACAAGLRRWLLVRCAAEDPNEHAYFLACGPEETGIEELVRVCRVRWQIEECLAEAKGEVGLDQYEARTWDAWHRHATLCLLAHAYLVVTRQAARREEAGAGGKGVAAPA